MLDDVRNKEQLPRRRGFLGVPLFRLLAINLAAGAALAALLVGGLLALNPFSLRDLILADRSPGTALGLLLFGFIVIHLRQSRRHDGGAHRGRAEGDDEPEQQQSK